MNQTSQDPELFYDPKLGYWGNVKEIAEVVNGESICPGSTLRIIVYESLEPRYKPEKEDREFSPKVHEANRLRQDLSSVIRKSWVPSVWIRRLPNEPYDHQWQAHKYQVCLDIRTHDLSRKH